MISPIYIYITLYIADTEDLGLRSAWQQTIYQAD